ncbi:hypothetical protein CcaverHIS002_0407670 [Cutaneotrichosporon cavernicola]|nr:hypothetical protein CcaverHIS002_0407670 [Cutaneotrichosporon cavernicola]
MKHSNSRPRTRDDGRRQKVNDFDRGLVAHTSRQLYDPSKSHVIPRSPVRPYREVSTTAPPPIPVSSPKQSHKERRDIVSSSRRALFDPDAPSIPTAPRRPAADDARAVRHHDDPGPSTHKLFDPAVHDPVTFNAPIVPPPPVPQDTLSVPERPSILRRTSAKVRSPEEEADLARERERRRRHRSEQGSVHTSQRKESDTRSRGSSGSQGSASLKDRERGQGQVDSGAKELLRSAYKEIGALEQTLIDMHRKMQKDPEAGITVLMDNPKATQANGASNESMAWAELISMHKELANLHSNFLKLALDPKSPRDLRPLPGRHNIPVRLWQTGYLAILERLRFAWISQKSVIALDLLTDFIYDAYHSYAELFGDNGMAAFRAAWIEALGDLARYRMAVAARESEAPRPKRSTDARIDDDDDEPLLETASIGQEVADNWTVSDKETWRTMARDWYAMGISEKPGEGRLHNHLALLCRDMRGQEPRALYHFAKSLAASHPFKASREAVLTLFDSAAQFQRSTPEATAMDLFVRLHGMLFTRIELDDFEHVMSRFMERLEEDASLDGVSRKACVTQVDWLFMGVVNIVAMLQYGSEDGIIRKGWAQESAARRRQAGVVEENGEVDDEGLDNDDDGQGQQPQTPPISRPDSPAPPSFTNALHLTFAILEFTFARPFRQQGLHQVLNPYISIMFTFLATIFRNPVAGAALTTYVPWRGLVEIVNSLRLEVSEETRLVNGVPLPEDWVIRGMEWVGRRVFERGFWKTKSNSRSSNGGPAIPRVGERFNSEMDVLLANFDAAIDITEGVVDEVDGADLTDGPVAVNDRRRRRVAWAAGTLVSNVDGLELEDGKVVIRGFLAAAIDAEEARKTREREEEEARETARRARQPQSAASEEDIQSEDEDEDPDLAILRDRRRHLRDILQVPTARSKAPRSRLTRSTHNVVPGYTILVFDTNVLLSALGHFSKVVEGGQWSVVVPLPVVTELDGLSKSPPPLGTEAAAAVAYLEARIRTHALCLKVQTSRGNYLTDLLIRAETLDLHSRDTARTMDDMILNVAAFQRNHFVDRSGLLGQARPVEGAPTQVLLVTFDRNLRLKARALGIDAADEREMAAILAK